MSATKTRVEYKDFTKTAPAAYAALMAMGKAVGDSGIEPDLIELVKLRASQINGCAFCAQHHLTIARKLAVAAEKLDLLAVWHDAGIFSPREMAAFAWTETLTHVARSGVSEDAYAAVRKHFSESETIFLTVAIGTINAWNRIGVALSFAPSIAHRTPMANEA